MLGEIVFEREAGLRIYLERAERLGLPVLRASLSPDGLGGTRRLRRAGRALRRSGVTRVLVPAGFARWEVLSNQGLRGVDPLLFLQNQAGGLVLAALARRGLEPGSCAVALRGERADRLMEQTARVLCPRVRDVCICAPRGGEELSAALRWEFGAAVRPDFSGVDAAVRFSPNSADGGGAVLDLFQPGLELCGVRISLEDGSLPPECEPLPLLAALWETGRVREDALEFT